jgi:hypothetical protein
LKEKIMSAHHTAYEQQENQRRGYVAPGGTGATITQTYATADATVPALTSTVHTYPGSGNLFDATPADLLINVRTDSVANAVADTVVNVKSLAANLNEVIADLLATKKNLNAVIDELQLRGILR